MAVAAGTGTTAVLHLPVETIASRFGDIPSHLPLPGLPNHSLSLVLDVLRSALSFTLLGGIESLLSAKIADGMTGRKHRYNMELVAQGIANVASALFEGAGPRGHFRVDPGDQPDGWNSRGLSRFDRAAMEKAGVGERRGKELTQVNDPSRRDSILQSLWKLAGRAAHAKRQRERAGC